MAATSSNYHVFVNHRGPDTKKKLASLLYFNLLKSGLRVFLDRKELHKGNCFASEIKAAIVSSSVQIAIFSPTYAESSWCLEELCLMLQQPCSTIIPIFFDVKPSDLRWVNKGQYAEAFTKHKNRGIEVEIWEKALEKAADITGYEFDTKESDWGEFIEDIVNIVQKKVRRAPLWVAEIDHPVGLDKAAENLYNKILKQMDLNGGITTIVGIAGLGGSGKTTLATYLYNSKHSEFQRFSFLCKIRGSKLTSLQKKLLKDLLGCNQLHIGNAKEGESLLREHLTKLSRVLIVLDDIDDQEQIDSLLFPVKDVLGEKSLIVITSRDKGLLARCPVNMLYNIELLDEKDAQELFRHHAFRDSIAEAQTVSEDLLREMVKMCGGYPFALTFLGAELFGKQERKWKVLLKDLQKNKFPPKMVDKIVKASYNNLEKEEAQAAFLHAASLFDEQNVQLVVRAHPQVECPLLDSIETLGQKCLMEFQRVEYVDGQIKYNDGEHEHFCIKHWIRPCGRSKFMPTYEDCKIGMHKLVKDMAKKIASEESNLCESDIERQMTSLDTRISDWVQQLPNGTTTQGSLGYLIVVDGCLQEFSQLNYLNYFLRRLRERRASYTGRQELSEPSAQPENLKRKASYMGRLELPGPSAQPENMKRKASFTGRQELPGPPAQSKNLAQL